MVRTKMGRLTVGLRTYPRLNGSSMNPRGLLYGETNPLAAREFQYSGQGATFGRWNAQQAGRPVPQRLGLYAIAQRSC
jgi:hypothetical protein